MVDIRRELAGANVAQAEPNKLLLYAGNAVATMCGIFGMCMLVMFSTPASASPDAVHTTARLSLEAPLDLTDTAPTRADIVRTGVLTESVSVLDAIEVLGADREDASAALETLKSGGLLNPKKLESGLTLTVHLKPGKAELGGRTLTALSLRPEAGRSVIAKRRPDGDYFGAEMKSRLQLAHRRVAGNVSSSLSADMQQAGADRRQVSKFLSVFAYNSAVPRKLAKGDRFEMVYEVWEDERGVAIDTGDVVYAALDSEAIKRGFYRYQPRDNGVTDFFDKDGDSAERFLIRKPVPGAYVSSRYGRRTHPIDGRRQMHKGVDLKAPMSARIYAAGDGVVEKIGRNGGYGRHVLIRHANGYKTGYAHMSGYSRQLYVGAKVKQGDLVGFVGSTGHSTGPHLHYEVIKDGLHVDPMALQLPTGRKLAAKPTILSEFKQHRREIDQIRRELGAPIQMASNGAGGPVGTMLQAEAP